MLFVHLFDLRCLVLSVYSSSWCLEWAAACDCGTPWTFLLPFLYATSNTEASMTTGTSESPYREFDIIPQHQEQIIFVSCLYFVG